MPDIRPVPPVKPTTTWALLKRMLGEHGRDFGPRYAVAFVFMAVFAACTSATAWLMRDVINKIFVDKNTDALLWIPAIIVPLFVIKGFASYFQEVTLSRIGNRLVAATQKRMFDHLLKMDVGYFQRTPSGELITFITHNANSVREMMNIIAVSIGRDLLTLIGLVIVMVLQSPTMALLSFIGGPFAAFGLKKLVKRIQKAASSEVLSATTIIGTVRETSQGIRIVKSFQLEDVLRVRMVGGVDAVERLGNKITSVQARVNPMIDSLGGFAVALVVLYAGSRSIWHGETPGQFFAFITALLLAADPARRLSRVHVQLAATTVGVRMMYAMLDQPALEDEKDGTKPALIVPSGLIEFEGVTFSYEPDKPVLRGLDMIVPAGKTTALVGTSGAGKTTIFALIQKFWLPSGGTISIDGQSLEGVALHSLRSQVALVSQDVFLFEGSIRENIAAGRRDATDEQIFAAARAAHADTFIRSLPQGYATSVGELGSQISGGQRQRISIARAFLKDAPIVLLDEPTSALDSETELLIQTSLKELTRARTTIVIAHRLATVMEADIIHVIDHGRVAESGTHVELVRRGGLYANLYRIQFADKAMDARLLSETQPSA